MGKKKKKNPHAVNSTPVKEETQKLESSNHIVPDSQLIDSNRVAASKEKKIDPPKVSINWSFLIQFGILLVTLAYCIVATMQWIAMRDTLDYSRDSSRLDQRAWVGVTGVERSEIQTKTRATVTIVNSGKTPAIGVKTTLAFGPHTKDKKFVFLKPPPKLQHSQSVVQPGMSISIVLDTRELKTEEIDAFNNGKLILYAFGSIEYQDIFKQNHSCTFCAYFTQDEKRGNACNEYNQCN